MEAAAFLGVFVGCVVVLAMQGTRIRRLEMRIDAIEEHVGLGIEVSAHRCRQKPCLWERVYYLERAHIRRFGMAELAQHEIDEKAPF